MNTIVLPQSELVTVNACDPSIKHLATSDMKCVLSLSKHLPTERYFVRWCWLRVATIEELVAALFRGQQLFRPMTTIIEAQAFAALLRYPIQMWERDHPGQRLLYRMIEQRIPKDIRIQQIQSPMERRLFYFQRGHSDQNVLMEQIEYFGTGSHDDGPDTLQIAYDYLKSMVAMPGRGRPYYPVQRSAFTDESFDNEWID